MAEAIYMGSILQLDTPLLASFSVFLAMGFLCLAFSAYFYLKRRAMQKLPKNLTVNVFHKTFNVFDLASKKRMIHSFGFFLLLSPLVAFSWTFVFVFVVILSFLGAGLILGLIFLVFSMGLMMIDEASEVRGNSNAFMKAVKMGKGVGAGDLAVMSLIDDASRRLITYYLLLGGIFFATFFVMPFVFPVAIILFARLVDLMVGITSSAQIFAPILTALLLALATLATYVVARKIKARILGFPSADSLLSAFSASVRKQITYEKLGDALEHKPEEETW
jgi:hypothetical protein